MEKSSAVAARTGLLYGLAAYGIWGVVPVYFKEVQAIPPLELLAHRIVWSAILLVALLAATGRIGLVRAAFGSRSALGMLALSTFFIAGNWYVFIYSVMSNQIMQGSLGYFMLPIVNVAIGAIFFNERLRLPQWTAFFFATAGVLVLILWLGEIPWIALTLAFSFSFYGVIRKHAPVDGTVGLTVEALLLTPIALGCLLVRAREGRLIFGHTTGEIDTLVVLSGLVTTIPLICFAQAVRRLRIVTIGFMQYISPTLAFIIAVQFYNEQFSRVHQVGYGLIWCGLALFVADALRNSWKTRGADRREAQEEEEKIREMEIMN